MIILRFHLCWQYVVYQKATKQSKIAKQRTTIKRRFDQNDVQMTHVFVKIQAKLL